MSFGKKWNDQLDLKVGKAKVLSAASKDLALWKKKGLQTANVTVYCLK
jgi:hypothetical protein